MPLRGGQPRLCRGGAHSAKTGHDRKAEMPREIRRLVEAAFAPPRSMKRNGNRVRAAVENIGAVPPHQRAERPRQGSASLVLERLHDRSQHALVRANRPSAVQEPRCSSTPWTMPERHADYSPRRKRIAAAVAERRGKRKNRSPARFAH